MGLANARREEWEMLGDEVVLDAVGKQMIRKIPNTLSKRRRTVAKDNLMNVGLSHDEFRHGGKRKVGFRVEFRGEFERVVYDRFRVVELFNEHRKGLFHRLVKRHNQREITYEDIVNGLLGSRVGALVIASTHELFGRQLVRHEDGRKFGLAGKDKAKLDSGVVVMLLIVIVRSYRNPLGRTAGRSVTGGSFGGRRARFPTTRGSRVIGVTHNLLEPDNTYSRDSQVLATRFVELGTMAVSLIQSRRAYKTVRLLR